MHVWRGSDALVVKALMIVLKEPLPVYSDCRQVMDSP